MSSCLQSCFHKFWKVHSFKQGTSYNLSYFLLKYTQHKGSKFNFNFHSTTFLSFSVSPPSLAWHSWREGGRVRESTQGKAAQIVSNMCCRPRYITPPSRQWSARESAAPGGHRGSMRNAIAVVVLLLALPSASRAGTSWTGITLLTNRAGLDPKNMANWPRSYRTRFGPNRPAADMEKMEHLILWWFLEKFFRLL